MKKNDREEEEEGKILFTRRRVYGSCMRIYIENETND